VSSDCRERMLSILLLAIIPLAVAAVRETHYHRHRHSKCTQSTRSQQRPTTAFRDSCICGQNLFSKRTQEHMNTCVASSLQENTLCSLREQILSFSRETEFQSSTSSNPSNIAPSYVCVCVCVRVCVCVCVCVCVYVSPSSLAPSYTHTHTHTHTHRWTCRLQT